MGGDVVQGWHAAKVGLDRLLIPTAVVANLFRSARDFRRDAAQPIRSSNSRSRLPRDQRSTTESTEIHGKENPNQLPLSVSFPGATPARRVGSFRGYALVMIFLAVVILPPAGNWVRFACPIPPWFVVSCDLPMINDRANWLRFALFRPPQAPSLRTHGPLFTRHSLHLPRSTPRDRRGPPPMPRAELGTALPTRQASICYALLRFRVFGRSLASLVFGAT